jgi:hypothetical protein
MLATDFLAAVAEQVTDALGHGAAYRFLADQDGVTTAQVAHRTHECGLSLYPNDDHLLVWDGSGYYECGEVKLDRPDLIDVLLPLVREALTFLPPTAW